MSLSDKWYIFPDNVTYVYFILRGTNHIYQRIPVSKCIYANNKKLIVKTYHKIKNVDPVHLFLFLATKSPLTELPDEVGFNKIFATVDLLFFFFVNLVSFHQLT